MGGEQPGLGVRRGSGGARVYAPRVIAPRGHSALCGLYSKRPFPFFF